MFGHLPTVLGEGNRRLSKRDKGSGLAEYRQKGYLPEALLNYLALLGWAIAEDRDVFTLAEMVEAFDILRVNANPARFDAEEVRGDQRARTSGCCRPEGADRAARAFPGTRGTGQRSAAAGASRSCWRRPHRWSRSGSTTLSEAVEMLGFLFLPTTSIVIEPDAGADRPTSAPALDAAATRP